MSETVTYINAVERSAGRVRLWRWLVGCSMHMRPPPETHGLWVTTDEWMEQVTWVWRQNAGSSDHRRWWLGEASWRGMTTQCHEDNDTLEHTTGIVSALELATSGVQRGEGLCVLTSWPRRSVERCPWWSWPLTFTFKLIGPRDQALLPCEFRANPFSGSRDISYTNKKHRLTAPKTEPSAVHCVR